jgi:hypothetical protein
MNGVVGKEFASELSPEELDSGTLSLFVEGVVVLPSFEEAILGKVVGVPLVIDSVKEEVDAEDPPIGSK